MKNYLLPLLMIFAWSSIFCQECGNQNVALQFDGKDDYLSFPGISASGDFSIGFWVEQVVINSNPIQVFLSFGPSNLLMIGLDVDGRLFVQDQVASFSESFDRLENKKCSHIGFVAEGSNRHIYLNFELIRTYQSNSSTYGPDLAIGSWVEAENVPTFFGSKFDHLRGYSIALSPSKFCLEMNSNSSNGDVQLFYDFKEGIPDGNNTNIIRPVNKGQLNNPGVFVGFDLSGNDSNYTCFSKEINDSFCENTDPCNPDVDPPFCITSKASLELNESGIVNLIPAIIDAGSFDACGGVTRSISETLLTCENLGVPNIVTLTVTDDAGNSSSCQDTIFVIDNISPSCSTSPTTLNIGSSGVLNINANDLNIQAFDNCGVQRIELSRSSFTCADEGTLTLECEVFDFSGNSEICEIDLIITGCDPCMDDTVPPVCNTVDIVNVMLGNNGLAEISVQDVDFKSFDDCTAIDRVLNRAEFSCEDIGQDVSVQLTVTDQSGNSTSCFSFVNVIDNISPTCSTSPTTLVIGPSGMLNIDANDLNIQAFDNCGVQRIELSRSTFTCADEGTLTIECEVFDFSENSTICEIDLIITGCDPCMDDNVPPVCNTVDIVNVMLGNNGLTEISVQDVDFNSFDDCTAIDRVLNRTEFSCEDIGQDVSVQLTVTDQSGNSASCFSLINVTDNISPTCTASPTTLTIGPSGTLTIDASDLNLQAFDNCGVDRIELSRTTFTCADSDGVDIDCTVYDGSNNSIVCSISLSFDGCENDQCEIDEIPPTCTVEDVTVYLDNDGLFAFDDNFINGLAEDNCAIASIELSKSQFNCEDGGYVNIDEIIVTACDLANNCTECSFNVLVVDIEPPSCYLENVVVDAKGEIGVLLVYDALLEDNCSIGGIEFSTEPGQIFECGEHVIEAIVTDSNGNKSDCFFALTVENCGECCGSNTGFLNTISDGFTVETIMPENPKCIVQLFPPVLNECQSILQLDWDDGTVMNGNFPWDVDFIHEYTDAGNYEVCITYAEASSTICFEEQVCLEFEITNDCSLLTSVNTQIESALTIYPNPCRDVLKVDIDNQNVFNDIVVYNINGQSLLTFDGNERLLDVSSLAAGLYYLHIIADDYSITENFIKVD